MRNLLLIYDTTRCYARAKTDDYPELSLTHGKTDSNKNEMEQD